jgi:hypothetical protein
MPFLTPTSDRAEWDAAWRALLSVTGDADQAAEHPASGEVWQYMGTVLVGDSAVHQFRHRHHPRTGTRYNVEVPATHG